MKKSSPTTSISKRPAGSGASRLLAYFDRRCAVFSAALLAARSYYAVEGIHDLRVEIKRLRSLYKTVAFITPSFAAKPNAAPLKELFRAAGRLRDIDIHQAIMLRHVRRLDVREYVNHLKVEELRLRKKFSAVSESRQGNLPAKGRAQISAALTATTGAVLQNRMRKRVRKLTLKLARLTTKPKQKSNDLHAIRKAAKALRYTLDVWQQCYGKTGSAAAGADRLKKTFNSLGEWHDMLLTLESVRAFVKRHSHDDLIDPAAYVTLERSLQTDAERLLTTYGRGLKPLQRTLDRLSQEFKQAKTKQKLTARG